MLAPFFCVDLWQGNGYNGGERGNAYAESRKRSLEMDNC